MIALNVCIYFILMVAVVAERVENLRKIQMRQLPANLFWARTQSPQFDYCADWGARAPDNGLPTQNLIVAGNVQMFGYGRHAQTLNHSRPDSQRPA
jgi:hypothetical protein